MAVPNAPTSCCADWLHAHDAGTDDERWGACIGEDPEDGLSRVGCDLPPINFCPWCGADKRRGAAPGNRPATRVAQPELHSSCTKPGKWWAP